MEEGLAQMMTQRGGTYGKTNMPSVEDVAMMLMQGADPMELEAQGIPADIIEAAIQIVMQQMQTPENERGLSASHAGVL